jgi:hypothetical protein
MKSYKNYINENINQFDLLPKDQIDWKLKIVDDTINKIDKYSDTISIRKSNNYINNILINSNICEFYKKYYELKGDKTKKLPIPMKIYDYEDLFLKIDNRFTNDNISLIDSFLTHLKQYLIFTIYFPNVLEYRDAEYLKHFKISFLDYLKDIDKYSEEEILNKQGLLQHALFFADSHDEYRSMRLLEDIDRYIDDIKRLYYDDYFKKQISNKEYNEQLDNFISYLRKKDYVLKDIFNHDYKKYDNFWIINPNDNTDDKKLNKLDKINFSGDFYTDYLNLIKLYNSYYR